MEDENEKLKQRLATVQSKATSALSEKDKLKSDLVAASSTTSRDSAVSVEGSTSAEELASLQAKIETLQTQLSEVGGAPFADSAVLFIYLFFLHKSI